MSIIVPAMNVARFLPRCLDSLLAQHHRPLEIIVVDDGSVDDTAAVLRCYAELHPEVQVISQQHRGLGPARNAALRVASGEFIAMVDADDWVEPNFISDLVGTARSSGAEVVVGNFTFDFWGLRLGFPFLPRRAVLTGLQAARLTLHLTQFPAFAWNKLYRRELFDATADTFPCIYYEDLATTPLILSRAREVAIVRKTYYHYCLRGDSITGDFGARNVFSFAAAIDILRHDLHANGRWEAWRPSYRRLLREALVMVSIQVLVQPNRIPVRSRGQLLLRYAGRLRALSRPPGRCGRRRG
ncbi:MAG: glycosyltransferase [Propionibacteriaceae bacterium]|nr:glycosyltransferase [Propionibacteriaceae bacterium]